MPHIRWALVAPVIAAAVLAQGCEDKGCLGGEENCRVAAPCSKVSFTCDASAAEALSVKTLEKGDATPGGQDALGAAGDVLLQNEHVQVVIAALGVQNGLNPTGGTIIDLAVRGADNDGLNSITHTTGFLPRDVAHYTSLEIIDERPERVAVQVKGTLDGYPEVPIYTIYELRPCDRGVRIRTESVNGWKEPQTWALADVFYWQDREPISFVAGPGLGFTHPSFGLTTANAAFRGFPFMAAASHEAPYASYSHVGCNVDMMEGLNNDFVTLSGMPRQVLSPREYLVFERMLLVENGKDVASAANTAFEVRRQLYGDAPVKLSGKVTRAGALKLDTPRETMIVVYEGEVGTPDAQRIPWTQVVPDASGAWSASVPAGKTYSVEVFSFGRKRIEKDVGEVAGDTDVGTLVLPSTSRVTVRVQEKNGNSPLTAEVFLFPANEQVRSDTVGSYAGHEWVSLTTECAPWLGPEFGGSPACNRVLVENGLVTFEAPMGTYHLYAFKGPFWTIDRVTAELTDGDETVNLSLEKLPLQPAQTLNADLHVHSGVSFDSSLPQRDRVLAFAASDLEVIVASEHDVAWDFQSTIAALGLQNQMTSLPGIETTAQIPFMSVPGDPFPRVIGHYIFWPLKVDTDQPRNGGPMDDLVEPGELFDRVDPLYVPNQTPLIMLPHPWGGPYFGRDTGFPRAIGFDLNRDLPAEDDGTNMGMFVRKPQGKNANDGHHAQEVMNGTDNSSWLQYRSVWFYMLNQGKLKAGTANSDSHSLTENTVGSPRNVVYTSSPPGLGFDVNLFNQSIRDGRFFGTNGPVIEATLRGGTGTEVGYSLSPVKPPADARVHVRISAAPWVPVQEIRFIVNGEVAKTISGASLSKPMDPFGKDGLVRFEGEVPLSELLVGVTGDAWLVIEAGDPAPLAADLGGGLGSGSGCANQVKDGVPDTGDNNGDGTVNCDDVGADDDYGPLNYPRMPDEETHPNFHFARVVTDGFPLAYTNPFILDRDGDGAFDGPGAGGGR